MPRALLETAILRIHPEGWPFIVAAGLFNLLLFLGLPPLGWLFLPVTVWVVAFFRDPDRVTPTAPSLVICPADGRLLPIVNAAPPSELGLPPGQYVRLSVFMNVFNVHVNRIPCNGIVTTLAYRPGRFFNASFDKASAENERMGIRLTTEAGHEIGLVQIAGLVARRIVCNVREGQSVCRGVRFGIIRFGSRVDVYLPAAVRVLASAGQSVRAGETVLAEFPS
ncbi:MAG TPA: phosphatidylserine decarboxylase [Rhizomicrobium sp.]|nr:phosphatidylserine decarboxylase [Rhizomicrobium sp.]